MKRKGLFIAFFICIHSILFGLNITIIESQITPDGSDADVVWSDVVSSMGHSPMIVPYSTMDDTIFFTYSDILIIPAGAVGLFSPAVKNILAFIKSGKSVYLQSEYLPNLTTNIAFRDIVITLGGSFEWQNMFTDYLEPMQMLGVYSTTPNVVSSFDYFWYSVSGKGDCNMIHFLEYEDEFHGFHYIPPNAAYGTISSTSDGDWVHEQASLELMENIIANLIVPPQLPHQNELNLGNDTTIYIGESLLLKADLNDAIYLWQDGSTESTFIVVESGIYWVAAQLDCGQIVDSISVSTASSDCFVLSPNIFSPNRDNVNDLFSVTSSCDLVDFSLQIYNRWGELEFQSNDQSKSWDGTYRGEDCITGVYTYLIQYKNVNGEILHSYGDLTLLR